MIKTLLVINDYIVMIGFRFLQTSKNYEAMYEAVYEVCMSFRIMHSIYTHPIFSTYIKRIKLQIKILGQWRT